MTTRVLVADDDPDIRMLMRLCLVQAGYEIEEAGDGAAALQACRDSPCEVAVLDINMPNMTGLEVARHLRADVATATMGIVLVSALATRDDVARGHEAGADVYLTKPFKVTGLTEAVQGLVPLAG